jgi:general secretion pathway protein E
MKPGSFERISHWLVGAVVVLLVAGTTKPLLVLLAGALPADLAKLVGGQIAWLVVSALTALAVAPRAVDSWKSFLLKRAREEKSQRDKVAWGEPDEQGCREVLFDDSVTSQSLPELGIELKRMSRHDNAEVVPIIDRALSQALVQHASDVHFEPGPGDLGLRFRIDGTLIDIARLPRSLHRTLINRLKVMSNLPPFEHDVPQDGRIFAKISGRSLDIRVSFMPTIHGEKVALRLFETAGERFDLASLGLPKKMLEEYYDLLTRPRGIIFVTGPTGSGKTTTMYASLRYIKSTSQSMVNIVTIEDPVEYAMPDFAQTQVNEDVGLDFAKGLRTLLRQDPDVIMLGEIRDVETAQTALQAGLTGHLLLTTVHADSTAGVFSRLMNMGIEPFLLASATSAVFSQRLVRRLCPSCRKETPLSDRQKMTMRQAGIDLSEGLFYTSPGCSECFNTGFQGRTIITELLGMSDELQQAIIAKSSTSELTRIARQAGMQTLLETGLSKALTGITSVAEVLRVAR